MERIKLMYNLEVFTFEEDQVEVVTDERDGSKWIPVTAISNNLGLDSASQREKVKNDSKFKARVIPLVAKDGKNRDMICIPDNRLTGFLFSINPNRIAVDIKEKLEVYQEQLADALHDWATTGLAINPSKLDGLVGAAFFQQLADQFKQQEMIQETVKNQERQIRQVSAAVEDLKQDQKEQVGLHIVLPAEIEREEDIGRQRRHLEDLMKFAGKHHPRYNYRSVWTSLIHELYTSYRIKIYKTEKSNYMDQIVRRDLVQEVYNIAWDFFEIDRLIK